MTLILQSCYCNHERKVDEKSSQLAFQIKSTLMRRGEKDTRTTASRSGHIINATGMISGRCRHLGTQPTTLQWTSKSPRKISPARAQKNISEPVPRGRISESRRDSSLGQARKPAALHWIRSGRYYRRIYHSV